MLKQKKRPTGGGTNTNQDEATIVNLDKPDVSEALNKAAEAEAAAKKTKTVVQEQTRQRQEREERYSCCGRCCGY